MLTKLEKLQSASRHLKVATQLIDDVESKQVTESYVCSIIKSKTKILDEHIERLKREEQ